MSDDPRSGDDAPRDPWGNPLPPEDRPPADPRPEDFPPPFPGEAPGTPGAVPPGYNPAWPPSADGPTPPPPGVPSQGWGQGEPWAPAKNDGLAVGALIAGIASLLCGIAGILGVVLGPTAITMGVLARRRVAASGGRVRGEGLGTAAIAMGVIGTTVSIVYLIIFIRNPDILTDIMDQLNTTTTTVPADSAN
ncbi:DUF4190 domain-containing protein [Rhabdothermincola salaria]|uniref:DUF4190 domain-containing protein n=1 Tax=Rhabdothermincola salaria TaxID=2903142 RepID=UPI001E5A175C|nr:DUF4190 domain-containing protein [Rhabdothermincola salaria]MCD9622346.1 hypothetical protein [Rhabdothermincola salaria]